MATLKSRSRTLLTFNLPHKFYCEDGECRCVDVKQHSAEHDNVSGMTGIAEREAKLATSITFLAGEKKTDLSETILDCPDVKGAIDRRELIVVNAE
jgi:hypothetical protein